MPPSERSCPWPQLANLGRVTLSPLDVEFFLIAEKGSLEFQAALLCESLRTFAGAYRFAAITVISPRKERRPSAAILRKLELLEVEYLELDFLSSCPFYGPSFKVYGAAHVERRSGRPILVQLDSDTLFVGEPNLLLDGHVAAARPVDVKGMCTSGLEDSFDLYWQTLCRLCGVDYNRLPLVQTTVDHQTVRASYNGGLIAVNRASGIFERTEMFFERGMTANLKPWGERGKLKTGAGPVEGQGGEYWGTSQAALSLAITAAGGTARILSPAHNVPLHYFDSISPLPQMPVHIHYHWLFAAGEHLTNPLLDGRMEISQELTQWLRQRVPLY